MWDMYQKKSDSKNFFKTLGVGDLWVSSVSDFAGESPLYLTVWYNVPNFRHPMQNNGGHLIVDLLKATASGNWGGPGFSS